MILESCGRTVGGGGVGDGLGLGDREGEGEPLGLGEPVRLGLGEEVRVGDDVVLLGEGDGDGEGDSSLQSGGSGIPPIVVSQGSGWSVEPAKISSAPTFRTHNPMAHVTTTPIRIARADLRFMEPTGPPALA